MQIIPSIAAWNEHPINRLYRAGVSLNVNTDTRMLTPTNLTMEYEGLQRHFGWGVKNFYAQMLWESRRPSLTGDSQRASP